MAVLKLLDFHPLLADRVRLSIVVALAAAEGAVSFKELLAALEITKGNLSAHAKKLESEKIVKIKKAFIGKIPHTTYEITKKGKLELEKYIENITQAAKEIK